MQETQKLAGDAAGVGALPARRRGKRGPRPWREVVGEYQASGLTIQGYCERSGISRSSMTRYLALARHAERSGDVQRNAGAAVAVAQTMAGFMRVGIVDRAVSTPGAGNSCDVPELILSDGVRLRLPAYALEPLLQALIDRMGAGAR